MEPSTDLYEGGRRSKRLATSKAGAKHKPPEEDVNMYECFSDKDKEDKEMEPEPSEMPTRGCPIIQKIARDICNEVKQARNESQKSARVVRRTRRKRRKVVKEVEEAIQETKEAIQQTKAAATRRLPRSQRPSSTKS